MKSSLSLAEELRAIRGGINSKSPSNSANQPAETERPWKSDIERLEQTLQEALRAISQFSGVDLSEGVVPSPGEAGSVSRLDYATIKERIRTDLETFSITTASEMAKQAEEQARAALAAVQSKMTDQIEQVVGEYRLKLQEKVEPQELGINVEKQSQERVAELVRAQTDEFARWVWLTCKGTGTPIPLQIEKLLEPYVEEATALVTGSVHQKIQDLLADQEKLVEERFQGTADSLQNQIVSLEQAAQQICEKNADSVTKLSTERLNAAADEASKRFEGRIHEQMEGSLGGIQGRLDETTAALLERLQQEQDERARDFIHRIEALTAEVEATKGQEIVSRMEQSIAGAAESSLQTLQQAAEGAVQRVQETGRFVNDSVEEGFKRVGEMLGGEGQDLGGFRERILADSKEHISSMVDEAVGSIEPRILQLAEEKVEAVSEGLGKSQEQNFAAFESRMREVSEGQYHDLRERIQKDAGEAGVRAAEEVRNASGSVMQELSEKVEAAASLLRKQQEESSSSFQSSVNDTLETFRQQLSEISHSGIEEQRKSMTSNLNELQKRLSLAAEALLADPPLPE
jgi:uncharacterized protein YdbL (DUF1318 family)